MLESAIDLVTHPRDPRPLPLIRTDIPEGVLVMHHLERVGATQDRLDATFTFDNTSPVLKVPKNELYGYSGFMISSAVALANLWELLKNNDGDIPPEWQDSESAKRDGKVRSAWFTMVIDSLLSPQGRWQQLQDRELKRDINRFYKKYTAKRFRTRLTTEGDINDADKLLSRVDLLIRPNLGLLVADFKPIENNWDEFVDRYDYHYSAEFDPLTQIS